jgi:hypothetical protein
MQLPQPQVYMPAVQVMEGLTRLEKRMDSQSLDPAPEHADMLKRMLSIGLYRYLRIPVPECIKEDNGDTSVVRRWHGEPVKNVVVRNNKSVRLLRCAFFEV